MSYSTSSSWTTADAAESASRRRVTNVTRVTLCYPAWSRWVWPHAAMSPFELCCTSLAGVAEGCNCGIVSPCIKARYRRKLPMGAVSSAVYSPPISETPRMVLDFEQHSRVVRRAAIQEGNDVHQRPRG